jgi:VIT1/CCC1 family predicted Fe2+/Mn2+ transporter
MGGKHSFTVGASFGSTSGVITTLGLIVGLHSGTHSKIAVLGGIMTIAIADAFSDALGIHMSEESEGVHSNREIWISTITTFIFKFLIASSFIIPTIIIEELVTSIIVNVIWGMILLATLSYIIGRGEGKQWEMIAEHVIIALTVVVVAHITGDYISMIFPGGE